MSAVEEEIKMPPAKVVDVTPQKESNELANETSENKEKKAVEETDEGNEEVKKHNFTAEAYDIADTSRKMHKLPRKEEIKYVKEEKLPPAPTGGWIFRPAKIVKQTVDDETKDEYWDIEFTDEEGGKGKISPTKNEHLIAPLNSKSRSDATIHDFEVDGKVDVLDIFKSKKTGKETKKWRKCQIIAVERYYIRVHYITWNSKWDEWLHVLEHWNRILPYGEMTEKALRERIARDKKFKELMEERHKLTVVAMAPDGNCLFRTVAHQVYGSVDKHKKVRQECCDYLLKNKSRFAGFVSLQGGLNISKYVKGMRYLGEWGGEAEIRALEELYDRPFVVYESIGDGDSTEPRRIHFEGDLPKEKLEDVTPIRVSYHGSNHYNSVVPLELLEKMDEKFNFSPPPKRKDFIIRHHRIKQIEDSEKEIQRIKAESKKKEEEEKQNKKSKMKDKTVNAEEKEEDKDNKEIDEDPEKEKEEGVEQPQDEQDEEEDLATMRTESRKEEDTESMTKEEFLRKSVAATSAHF